VGPRAGLDVVERENLCPCRKSNPGGPARSLVTVLTKGNILSIPVNKSYTSNPTPFRRTRNCQSCVSSLTIATGQSNNK
jgi:hypothetical protein